MSHWIETLKDSSAYLFFCRAFRAANTKQWLFKDVRAHCYCASLVRTQFIRHVRATSFSTPRALGSRMLVARFWLRVRGVPQSSCRCQSRDKRQELWGRECVPRHLFKARAPSRNSTNIELMTFALTWCANIFVGCSVTPTFFSADHFLFWFFPLY